MRDPARILRILAKLETYWEIYPDLRLGQIIENLARNGPGDTFTIEDNVIEARLTQAIFEARAQQARSNL